MSYWILSAAVLVLLAAVIAISEASYCRVRKLRCDQEARKHRISILDSENRMLHTEYDNIRRERDELNADITRLQKMLDEKRQALKTLREVSSGVIEEYHHQRQALAGRLDALQQKYNKLLAARREETV